MAGEMTPLAYAESYLRPVRLEASPARVPGAAAENHSARLANRYKLVVPVDPDVVHAHFDQVRNASPSSAAQRAPAGKTRLRSRDADSSTPNYRRDGLVLGVGLPAVVLVANSGWP